MKAEWRAVRIHLAKPRWLNALRFSIRAVVSRRWYGKLVAHWLGWPTLDTGRTYLRINSRRRM